MKKAFFVIVAFILMVSPEVFSQSGWPREIVLDNGLRITIYQPQPESLSGNKLLTREVVTLRKSKKEEPVFGVVWTEAALLTDKDNRTATMEVIKVTRVRFPDMDDQNRMESLSTVLETEIPKWNIEIALDQIIATLEEEKANTWEAYNTKAPEIIYRAEPTTLILIDGDPVVKMDDQLKAERVINTPFLIIRNPDDRMYYLFAGRFWYVSAEITSGWSLSSALPVRIKSLDAQIKNQEKENQETVSTPGEPTTPTAILVSTKPAELIQSKGEATYASIESTGLLYLNNSEDDIFKYITDQQYYVLLAGRWYTAPILKGPWKYVPSEQLPADFAKIPEGSDKDVVLANVAGTDAAREAVIDAQIPQTAKVYRSSSSCTVTYDGEPRFERIEGTNLYVAKNTSGTVIRANDRYYAVENGVWFVSEYATGPWSVSTERPSEVDRIPPSSPVYNTKYVYIYEVTPEYVYMGYTPGYLGCYVYGPTVIYGTGYYYDPWYGVIYYPRPITWGFGMHYNPWAGWCMHTGYGMGYFHYPWFYMGYGGWWGPPVYRPPFRPPYHPGQSHHYGPRPAYYSQVNASHYHTNNVYRSRRDVQTRDINRGPATSNSNRRPSTTTRDNPANQPTNVGKPGNTGTSTRRPVTSKSLKKVPNNVYSDRSGNVYQRESSGTWRQRERNTWQSTTSGRTPSTSQMDRSGQMRDRGTMRTKQATQSTSPASRRR